MSSPDRVAVRCPECDQRISIPRERAAQRLRCPSCKHIFTGQAEATAAPTVVEVPPAYEETWPPPEPQTKVVLHASAQQRWPKAKINATFDHAADVVYEAAVQAIRSCGCDVLKAEPSNRHIEFSCTIADRLTYHNLHVFSSGRRNSEVEIISQDDNVDGFLDPRYRDFVQEVGKYLMFVAPAPARRTRDADYDYDDDDRPRRRRRRRGGYSCPFCDSPERPFYRSQISSGGWVVFVVMLVLCWPLFWIGLLMTEQHSYCPDCGMRVGY